MHVTAEPFPREAGVSPGDPGLRWCQPQQPPRAMSSTEKSQQAFGSHQFLHLSLLHLSGKRCLYHGYSLAWCVQGTPGGLAGEQEVVVTNVTPFGARIGQLLTELDHLSIAPGAEGRQDEITSLS